MRMFLESMWVMIEILRSWKYRIGNKMLTVWINQGIKWILATIKISPLEDSILTMRYWIKSL